MKKLFLITFLFLTVAFGSTSAIAQCDRNTASPIRCGFYDEGYEDGVNDGRSNRSDDYRRYRNKFSGLNQYENFYRDGYNAGYASVRPTVRWTASQRNAYDSGYNIGQNDRRYGQGRPTVEAQARYDSEISLYFQQGYDDGFNNRARRYDFAITGGFPTYPPSGGGTPGPNSGTWSGRVDDRANIIIRGATMRSEDVSGTGLQVTYQNMNGSLPRRAGTVTARKVAGRGDVRVIQQPNRSNDYTAIIQVSDSRGGADTYNVDISWDSTGSNVQEPYRSGSVRWRGRVDQTATISIAGSDVQSQDTAGTGLSGVNFDINGYLARRVGSVTVRKRSGRGSVTVLQQPSWENDFTAIIQVFDPGGGSDEYDVEINW
jgi:hypothetical protein